MEVSFGSKRFSADILDGILDHLWTSHESEEHLMDTFDPAPGEATEETQDVIARFHTFLALSLTCSTFRQLCLPRLFGSIYICRFRTLGLLWKAIRTNPILGSYVHSFTIRIRANMWPMVVEPSDGLDVIFKGQTIQDLSAKVQKFKPGAWNDKLQWRFRQYCQSGPDDQGIDPNLKSAEDLKEALVTIFNSFQALNNLNWDAHGIPFLTPMIEHLENLDCLRTLMIDVSCCEEDFFYSQPPLEGALHPPTPLWKLSKNVRELELVGSGPGLRDYEFKSISDEPDESEAGPRLQRRMKTLIQTIDEAENLDKIDLTSLGYFGENEKRPEVVLGILPRLCCLSNISLMSGNTAEVWKKWDVTLLYPALLSLSERKGTLAAEDIRSLGKDAEKNIDHPLSAFAGFLQEEELSEKIVERWNKRYSSG